MRLRRRTACAILLSLAAMLPACGGDKALLATQALIIEQDAPRLSQIVSADLAAHRAGVAEAAAQLARGFAIKDATKREQDMRAALKYLQHPKHGVTAFVASPMSFLAAIDAKGIVVARDRDDDRMRGQDFATRFRVVREALDGRAAEGLGEFLAKDATEPSSWSVLLAAPVKDGDRTVGAVVVGIPLWRLAQRLSRQLRIEAQGPSLPWVYLARGNRLFHWDTPPEVDAVVPDAKERERLLHKSPREAVGRARIAGGGYQAFGVLPLRVVSEDLAAVVFRNVP